jgi:GNAT superfamily N-acetyltransferase
MREYIDKTWGWDEAWQRTRFDENFDPLSFRVIEKDGKRIGHISVRCSRDEIFLSAIEIAPEHQYQGVATQLINELLAESDLSRLPVKLLVLKVNPARRLYERLGFRCTGETSTHDTMIRGPVSVQRRHEKPVEPPPVLSEDNGSPTGSRHFNCP